LFFQDIEGKRQLRLDYGERRLTPTTTTIDYHWNQEGTHRQFGITSHTPVGSGGRAAYHAAKYFRYAGGVLVVAGVAIDIVSIVRSSRPLRRASQVVASWAGAWIGCKAGGAVGAVIGTAASPIGTAVGGTAGCIIGGFGGYVGASTLAVGVFDWAEGTFFPPLPQVNPP